MKAWVDGLVLAVKWIAEKADALTTSVTIPASLVLALLAPTALRVVVIVVGLIWLAAKILQRLPGGEA